MSLNTIWILCWFSTESYMDSLLPPTGFSDCTVESYPIDPAPLSTSEAKENKENMENRKTTDERRRNK